jgi:pentatricopeptide repeat protein
MACIVPPAAFIAPASAQGPSYSCSAPPAIEEAFRKLDFPNEAAMTSEERSAQRQAIFDSLFAQYPDNFFVHRRYQDFKRRALRATGEDLDSLIKEYRALLEKHPNDPKYLDLYGRALDGQRNLEAAGYYEKALQLDPSFAWAHLELATIYAYGKDRDPARCQSHIEAFMRLCPSSLEGYKYLRGADGKEFLAQAVQHMRKLLANRTDPEALDYYPPLWSLEFRAAPPSEYKQAYDRVAGDVKRWRELNLGSNPDWYEALYSGYKTLDDEQGQKWVEDQLLKLFPQSSLTVRIVMERERQTNPYPKEDSPPEDFGKYYKALYQATGDWIRLWPQSPMARAERFRAATHSKDLSDAEVEAAAEDFLTSMEKNRDLLRITPPPATQVAQEYVKRGIRLASVPQLVANGFAEVEKYVQDSARSDNEPPEFQHALSNTLNFIHWQGWTILVDGYMKANQPDKAREVLFQMETFLGEHQPDKSATPGARRAYIDQSRNYWEEMARVAEAQNRKLDALAYYQNALTFPHQHSGEDKQDDQPADKARQLWKALGGTDEGWFAWAREHVPVTTAAGEEEAWTNQNKPLPDFNLPDLSGRIWRLQDVKGKVTFLNFWATTCGPCRAELPMVQKLYESMKDRPDVLVLTVSTDENPGLIEPFLRQFKYTFPVIPARSFVERLNPVAMIPMNEIVDRNGVLRKEQVGYSYKGDEWLDKMNQSLEEVRNGK